MALPRRLNDGFFIPVIGLGMNQSCKPGEVETAVKYAIDAGYRHFDCAWIYGNESEVGTAIRAKIKEKVIKREDIFITTKLWNNFHRRRKVVEMLQDSLKAMKLSYVDLYLIHWPIGFEETAKTLPMNDQEAYSDIDYLETWKGMEDCITCGFTRSIGLANFNSAQIERVLKYAKIKPVVNQIEVHSEFNQKKLIKFCTDRDIIVTGYCPLGSINELSGSPGFPEPTILDERIRQIARKHHKTAAQVVLNYLVSLGICVVPKSVTKVRIVEHINIFDFKLDPEDVEYLDSCNKNQRMCPFNAFTDHKYYPFNLEY